MGRKKNTHKKPTERITMSNHEASKEDFSKAIKRYFAWRKMWHDNIIELSELRNQGKKDSKEWKAHVEKQRKYSTHLNTQRNALVKSFEEYMTSDEHLINVLINQNKLPEYYEQQIEKLTEEELSA